MSIRLIETTPIAGQKPGTSGLRKKTAQFQQPHFLENFVQSMFDATGGAQGKTYVLGGDGRFFVAEAVQIILRMAAANGAARVIVGAGGLLSTPAASGLIIERGTDGGIILSASHNPGGAEGDFGVKFNMPNGGPAPESVTEAIYSRSQTITAYRLLEAAPVALERLGESWLGEMVVEVVDPVAAYATRMEKIFDFDAIAAMFHAGFRMRFDGMNAVTGPYARAIFEERLGAAPGSVMRGQPLEDFGGTHPDPNPAWADELMAEMMREDGPDFGAASDGDGDRNMVLGRKAYVSPSDSLAILAANAHLVPGYRAGLKGLARSMPTSRAADRVAEALGIPCFETPTGWKFFGNLLDSGQVTLCGEESFAASSDHVREKDGLWAVLFWLNILAARRESVAEILTSHWQRFGRNHYSRHDYEAIDAAAAEVLMAGLRAALPGLPGSELAGRRVESADEFTYTDPVDGSISRAQGLRIGLHDGARIIYRLSGTGTEGATLRVYLEAVEDPYAGAASDGLIDPLAEAARSLCRLTELTGRVAPDVVT